MSGPNYEYIEREQSRAEEQMAETPTITLSCVVEQITLRDIFAAFAAAGFANLTSSHEKIASSAYAQADAMLLERETLARTRGER